MASEELVTAHESRERGASTSAPDTQSRRRRRPWPRLPRPSRQARAHASPSPHSLREQLLVESEAMARHALASGTSVPSYIIRTIERASEAPLQGGTDGGRRAGEEHRHGSPATDVTEPPVRDLLAELSRAHAELMRLVAPASPRTIILLSEEGSGRLAALGPVRLVRHMLVAVIVLLAVFIALAATSYVSTESGDIFTSTGLDVLANELFFLAAGGIGAAFSALFTAYRYIAEGTYDPKYESSYWVRFILGLIAGVLLASLIPVGEGEGGAALTKPLLALLGGFSAAVVYRILERLVETVESLVRGDSRELQRVQAAASAARETELAAQERTALLARLLPLQQQARSGKDPGQIAEELDRILKTLVPHERREVTSADQQGQGLEPGPSDGQPPGDSGERHP